MERHICIHSHFYQPPRENPWLEEVQRQESAYPYHDWNERITAECYLPNTKSPIFDHKGNVVKTINNYEKLSFNFGPTLLSWMQKRQPDVYKSIIDADKKCREHFSGHGSAIAQVYNHVIMPLANRRDKETQVIWGIKDFEFRYGRYPEGIWLSETAVDIETLEVVAENDIKFTILAPRQANYVRKIGDNDWSDVRGEKIDTRMPYLCKLPSGKSVSIFFYDGRISQGIAFGSILNNGEDFAKRLLSEFSDENGYPQLVNIASDGETFGHHRRYGEMALAYCFNFLESSDRAKVSIYGEFLEQHPPVYEVQIEENSSWSCEHGIERWKNDCGCNAGANPGWSQQWREPLRNAMDWVRDRLVTAFDNNIAGWVKDPWYARNCYIDLVLDNSDERLKGFFGKHAKRKLSKKEILKALKLFEMQRYAMFMFTSCGWFFDDISRIETVQLMQCAARAMQIADEVCGETLEAGFLNILKEAKSNVPEFSTGDNIYEMLVKPTIPENSGIKLLERLIED